MIFGFNTDIKHEGTVYHVQSEARESEKLLQTQVFIGGRCVAKRAQSYAEQAAAADFSEEEMHEALKAQHRVVVEALRAGDLNAALGQGSA